MTCLRCGRGRGGRFRPQVDPGCNSGVGAPSSCPGSGRRLQESSATEPQRQPVQLLRPGDRFCRLRVQGRSEGGRLGGGGPLQSFLIVRTPHVTSVWGGVGVGPGFPSDWAPRVGGGAGRDPRPVRFTDGKQGHADTGSSPVAGGGPTAGMCLQVLRLQA